MRKGIIAAFLLLAIVVLGKAQVNLLPNLVSTKQFNDRKDIWPTFTQGVVHYAADVMFIYGEVYVTPHMPDSINHTAPTFRETYLMPIYSQYKKNQGKVNPNYDEEMFLFINIKYDPVKTYKKLWEQLSPYHELLTYRRGPAWHDGKLKIIFVGNAPMRIFQQERVNFVAAQGTIADLEKGFDNKIMPLIGIDFEEEVEWNGVGKMPFNQFMDFKNIIKKAHDQGKKVRIYNCPEEETIWDILVTTGVDMISATDTERFGNFMATKK